METAESPGASQGSADDKGLLPAKEGTKPQRRLPSRENPTHKKRRRSCHVFWLLYLKNMKVTVRRKASLTLSLLMPILLCITLIILIEGVYKTKTQAPRRYFPLQTDSLLPFDLSSLFGAQLYGPGNEKIDVIKLMQNDPLIRKAIADGCFLPLGDIFPSYMPELFKNFVMYSVAFAPRSSLTLRIMKRVQQTLQVYRVVDFPTETSMVNALRDDHQLDLSQGVGTLIASKEEKYLCGIVFEDLDKMSQKIRVKIRFPFDSFSLTNVYDWISPDIDLWITKTFFKLDDFLNREFTFLETENKHGVHTPPQYYDKGFIAVQWAVSASLMLELNTNSKIPMVAVQQLPFPGFETVAPIRGLDMILLIASYIFLFMDLIRIVALEKQSGMKEMLCIMGVSKYIQYAAWWLRALTLITPVMISSIVAVYIIFGKYVDIFVIILFFFLYFIAFIASALFIITWVSSALAATVIGAFLYVVSVGMAWFFKETSSLWSIILSSLFINLAANHGFNYFYTFFKVKATLTICDINTKIVEGDTYTLFHIILMLIGDSIVFILLSFYLEEVNPGTFGVKKHPCFCFLCKNCRKYRHMKRRDIPFNNLLENDYYEPVDPMLKYKIGIAIRNLVKEYGTKRGTQTIKKLALKGISLDMYEDEIFVLLGHNGAGKSTTMNIICGYYTQTSGNVWVNGLNTKQDIQLIRENMTFCPQHDVLFDELTVEEHLRFFGSLQNISIENLQKKMTELFQDLRMEDKRDTKTKKLSGGTKRKTCMAIALIGDAKISILDEPTSGVDVTARHHIWKVIEKAKKGRTILLSTHFMDEAEALSDRVAIMAAGLINCCGSPAFLKKKFGVGYQLTIVKGSNCNHHAVGEIITKFVPGSTLERNVAGEISYLLPKENPQMFPGLFQYLDTHKDELGIISYGASMDSMEEVYIRAGESMLEMDRDVNVNILNDQPSNVWTHEDSSKISLLRPSSKFTRKETDRMGITLERFQEQKPAQIETDVIPRRIICLHLKTMLIKRILSSFRNWRIILLALIIPVVMTIMGLTIWLTMKEETQQYPALVLEASEIPGHSEVYVSGRYQNFVLADSFLNVIQFAQKGGSRLKLHNVSAIPHEDPSFLSNPQWKLLYNSEYSALERAVLIDKAHQFTNLINVHLGASFTSVDDYCYIENTDLSYGKWANENNTVRACRKYYSLRGQDPVAQKGLRWLQDLKNLLFNTMKHDGISTFNGDDEFSVAYYSPFSLHSPAISLSEVTKAIFKMNNNGGKDRGIEFVNAPLKATGVETQKVLQKEKLSGIIAYKMLVLSMSIITPFFVYSLIKESQSGAKHLQVLSGVRLFSFWLANYIWDFLFFHLPVLCILILLILFNFAILVQPGLDKMYLAMMLYGLSQLSMTYVFSFAFKDSVLGIVILVVINVLGSIVPDILIELIKAVAFKPDQDFEKAKFENGSSIFFSIFFSTYVMDQTLKNLAQKGKTEVSCKFDDLAISDVQFAILRNPAVVGFAFQDVSNWGGYIFTPADELWFFSESQIFPTEMQRKRLYIKDLIKSENVKDAICKVYKNFDSNLFYGDLIIKGCCDESSSTAYYEWNKPGIGQMLTFLACQTVFFTATLAIIESVSASRSGRERGCGAKRKLRQRDVAHKKDDDYGDDDLDVAAEKYLIRKFLGSDTARTGPGSGGGNHVTNTGKTRKNMRLMKDGVAMRTITAEDLIVDDLVKAYDHFVAVDGISFSVSQGESFGLLGVNGAGKSTTFKVLSGEIQITQGNVWLTEKYNISNNLREIQHHLGYCPQHDGLIAELTGKEMLMMFASLRGFRKDIAVKMIKETAEALLLTEHLDRQCGSYSGGNKRKLSVAIAMIGKPKLVLLDEPSTGVDPIARRKLWDAIIQIRDSGEQSIILTSHVMEECEVLCSRLCIMVKGRMKCIGTPQYLKSKFAQGYTVFVEFASDLNVNECKVKFETELENKFVGSEFKFQNHSGTIFTYQIPKGERTSWADVFEFFEQRKSALGVVDYSVTQTTLEEVFLRLTLAGVEQNVNRDDVEIYVTDADDDGFVDIIFTEDEGFDQNNNYRARRKSRKRKKKTQLQNYDDDDDDDKGSKMVDNRTDDRQRLL